jgi:transposase
MGKSYRPYYPDEELLLPPSLRDWLPENHLAYFVGDVVDNLDLRAMDAVYGSEKRGQPPYDPQMMTKILVYGYCVGVFSSRRIERHLVEDIAFRVLAAGNQPNFRTISDFRKIHLKTLEGLFEQVLKIALEAGAMKVGRVAIDGTKVKANASKHKAMSYDRMKEKEAQLKAEVKDLLAQAAAADAEEDALYGKDRRGDELPEELQRRESRLKKIREAKKAVEARAKEKAASEGTDPKQAKPKDKDQYNFTDPESRIMKGADGFVQAYNAQAAVEADFQLIVGQTVTAAANDKEQLVPMLDQVELQSGQRPCEVLADSGYCSEQNLEQLESETNPERRVDGYIATGRQKHGEYRDPCPRGPLPQGADASGTNETEAENQSRQGCLCRAEDNRGTCFRADQTSARFPAVSASGNRQSAR